MAPSQHNYSYGLSLLAFPNSSALPPFSRASQCFLDLDMSVCVCVWWHPLDKESVSEMSSEGTVFPLCTAPCLPPGKPSSSQSVWIQLKRDFRGRAMKLEWRRWGGGRLLIWKCTEMNSIFKTDEEIFPHVLLVLTSPRSASRKLDHLIWLLQWNPFYILLCTFSYMMCLIWHTAGQNLCGCVSQSLPKTNVLYILLLKFCHLLLN